ncbi:oligosaccharyl transferase subunit ost3/OST6 [Tulasnella sp. JGI-2019a]|nr:oligosaccharyl transferase subunit ost3/OST6 [Tulasnella sp. JGI-2019a]KAG8992493.1 oligosaccharyl transferase subunit ost3/OST6 [Tulasnella sp. JGI-2019a]KAG9024637.1 oligosaccharyl transferase subunit ost3/OST6 [Tulasnella sp. JGI-2019a]
MLLPRLNAITAVLAGLASLCAGQKTREDFARMAAAEGGVIKLDTATFDAITAPDRDWSVVIELTATSGTQVACTPCLTFLPNFEAVAKAWRKVAKSERDQHFFARLEFKDGNDIFRRLGLTSAPFVNFYPAQKGPLLDSHPSKSTWSYDFNAHGLETEPLVEQLSKATPVKIPYTAPLNWPLIGGAAGTVIALFIAYKVFGDIIIAFLSSRWIWGIGSLALIITMLSGFMFVRIRHSPYAGQARGPNGQPVIQHIAAGYQNQFGAEVQIIGAIYTLLACSQIALMVFVPRLPSVARQRGATYIWLGVTWMLFSVLVSVFKQKNSGYPFKLLLG